MPNTSYTQDLGTPQVPTYDPNAAQGTAGSLAPSVPSTISSNTLNTPSSGNFSTPQEPPIYNVGGLNTGAAYTNAKPEQQAQDYSTQLQSLNDQLAGKAADTTEAYKSLGIGTITDANGNIVGDPGTADLSAKLTQLQNEAQAIPLQLQNSVEGRGVTAAGLAPIQTAALRNNAISALQVSSTIAAKNGQLVTAEHLVNQYLTQKYGPIEAQIKAKTDNLNLLLKSPDYTNAEKVKAQAQLDIQNQHAAALELQKTNELNAQTEALKYAPIASAQQLAELQKATSPIQVATIAAQYGLQAPQAGRYKDSITTATDAYGNQYQTVRVFDTITGQFVGHAGQTAAQFNTGSGSGGASGGSSPSGVPSGTSTSASGLSFQQYGLLAKTDYNPSSTVDSLAFKYLDSYVKNGTVPTASTLGRSIKPQAMAQITARASDLYFKATGQPLPNPEIIKGYQQQLIGNNKLLNSLNVQEGVVGKNAALLLQNLSANNLNTQAQPLNTFIDGVRNMLGDPAVAQYLAQNATVSNELGSLLSLKNAQGTTVYDKLIAADIINKGDSQAQIAAKVKILLQEAVNSRSALEGANANLYQQTDPLLQDSNNPGRTQASNAAFVEKSLVAQGLHYDSLIAEMTPQAPAGHQPALDAATGKPVFATPEEIKSGKYIPL